MLKDSSLQIINTLTDPLVSESEYSGTATGYADGVATLSTAGVSTNTIIANGAFSGRWPVIVDGQAYPKFGQSHTITLSQSGLTATISRVINQPIAYSLVVLVSPVINDLTYPTALFDITPVTGDQVLYVTADCTMSPDGGLVTSDPKSTIIVHRVEATGICYAYKFIINSAKALSVVDNGVTENENLNEKIDHVASNDNQSERPSLHDASVKSIQINYTASRRQLPEAISHEDHLNRRPLISALAAVLAHKANYEHQTIGLLGDWGSGKSTFISLLKEKLQGKDSGQPFIFGEFNAWKYEHTDNLQAGIAQEMIKALTSLQSETPKKKGRKPNTLTEKAKQVLLLTFQYCTIPFKWLYRQLNAFVLRIWLSLWFAVCNQPKQLLKTSFILLVFLAPFIGYLPDWLENNLLLKSVVKTESGSGVDLILVQALWVSGFGFYFFRELMKLMANPMAKELLTYLQLPDYAKHLGTIPVMRENIRAMCHIRLGYLCGKPKRFLFVVDDLDRCSHTGIVKVFEAVRLVLDLDNVIVIIAIDQKIALAALALHYAELSEHHNSRSSHVIARDYLAKVIHMPITLKKSNADEVAEYLHSIWNDTTDEKTQKELAKLKDEKRAREEKIFKQDNSAGDDMAKTAEPIEKVSDEPAISAATVGKEEPVTSVLSSLSGEHKDAFIEWVNIFSLVNSRQLKRLNNSYNLLRSYCPKLDSVSIPMKISDAETKAAYPMMLTLILMEYLNNLEDRKIRKLLWSDLFVAKKGAGFSEQNLLNHQFIDSYRKLREEHASTDIVANVEAFVLPAID